ncbi:hypothetical protein E8E12_002560 [Didymella heteroderae]|uniref:Uncharacterized protein n=1 Tax=Didymella heteroderae TaxID=1769908 RepID=A0A9P5BUY4_9PLEO|nr:hypothetical protein E8E12_002560 [Didymella heteroderae]
MEMLVDGEYDQTKRYPPWNIFTEHQSFTTRNNEDSQIELVCDRSDPLSNAISKVHTRVPSTSEDDESENDTPQTASQPDWEDAMDLSTWHKFPGQEDRRRRAHQKYDSNDGTSSVTKLNRTRTEESKQFATRVTGTDRGAPRTPSPGADTKRSSDDLQATGDKHREQATDTKALYEANKEEIEQWYDEDFSRKQGIPPWGKTLRSNHRWYQKVHAWMKMKGLVQSPKKKRKLNDGTPVSDSPHEREDRQLKTHQIRYSGDLVPVPEYPLDQIEDYTPAPDGRYACSHVHLKPPKDCCKFGLIRPGKKAAIKKEIIRWKGKIEKLIDKKQLDKRHMTWPDWTVQELRQKHQPALWAQQEAKRRADAERKRRKVERHMKRQEEMGRSNGRRTPEQPAANRQSAVARPVPVPDSQHRPFAQMTAAHVTSPSNTAPFPSPQSAAQRPITYMRRRSDSDTIASVRTTFLASLAWTNPRLLRSHEALYRDAQYRENQKEQPNFDLRREWYLAYLLKQQRQQLTAEQSALLESSDPSHKGRKHIGSPPILEGVDELFSEYIHAGKADREAQRSRQELQHARLGGLLGKQSQQVPSHLLAQPATTLAVHADVSAEAEAYVFEELFGDQESTPLVAHSRQDISQMPFRILSPEELDSELDRILGLAPPHAAEFVGSNAESRTHEPTVMHTETSSLTTPPWAFEAGNRSVDDEMQLMLEYAYQTGSLPPVAASEDEQRLRQTVNSQRDWQRYCDFFSDKRLLPERTAPVEQRVFDEFNFGEILNEKQLAVFDEFDDGQPLFAEHGARIAAAHAANLARYRETKEKLE